MCIPDWEVILERRGEAGRLQGVKASDRGRERGRGRPKEPARG